MSALIEALKAASVRFDIVLPFWPLILLPALVRRWRSVLEAMIVLWLVFVGGWLLRRSTSPQPVSFLIPEPLNTYLFLGAGAVLIGLFLVRGGSARGKGATGRGAGIPKSAVKARWASDLLKISPSQLVEMVVELYQMRGAKAQAAEGAGDHRVDVVVQTPKGEKWVVQCKPGARWVGEPQVRDFYEVMQDEKADRGVLVTTAAFSGAARAWARGKPMVLVDGAEFLKNWKEAKRG